MSTSETITFLVSTTEIVTEALELLGVLSEGETPNTDQLTSSIRTLNMMTKTWQAEGLNLFAVKKSYLFVNKTQTSYNLQIASTDHFVNSFSETTTSASSLSGTNTVTLTDVTGLISGDSIGIYTTNAEVEWNTINGAPVGSVVTLTNNLTADVDSGAVVYSYHQADKSNRPMLILEAYDKLYGSTSIPVRVISRTEYYNLTNRDTSGVINQVYYDPQIGANANLFVWPTGSDERNYLELLTQRTLDDFNLIQEDPDFPQEWYMPLATNLAKALSPKYGIPQQDYIRLMKQADEWYETSRGFDSELETSLYFQPDNFGNRT